jgi:hypothetical protein
MFKLTSQILEKSNEELFAIFESPIVRVNGFAFDVTNPTVTLSFISKSLNFNQELY